MELEWIVEQVESESAFVITVFPTGEDHRTYTAPDCGNGLPIFVQAAHFNDERRNRILQSAVRSSFRSETDRAALLVHEAVYRVLRLRFGAQESVGAQNVTGELFSIQSLRIDPNSPDFR